tara:strand:+ start:94 stop:312 length:219 start_codon:yes stop_codon:yes gene_type:complete
MPKTKLDYIKTVERLDAQIDLLHEQLGALNIALDAKYKEYHLAKKKVLMLDPEIAKEDAMVKDFMKRYHKED